MLFNSIDFALFLPLVFVAYWGLAKASLHRQNLLVVAASYLFYAWWDWRFLFLIVFSSAVDFFIGRGLFKTEIHGRRKLLLWLSLVVNLSLLGFFKYFNFFIDSFVETFRFLGAEIEGRSLDIVLPVGISFYTFQTLSYTIDVYRKKLEPCSDFISFSAFVSFFPQLVAGPIERASHLLPQFYKKRQFDYAQAVDGLRQMLWGFFKKIVIADNSAKIANEIFSNSDIYPGSTLLLGAIFFAFQIYGDFSGYSDIAIGTARLFGFKLRQNFAFPYFSRDIAEFWRRWHISLSTWFRDYLYIPLGGSKGGTALKVRNTFIIFVVSGFWHGANWTFIVWGALNALYFLPLLLLNKNRRYAEVVAQGSIWPKAGEVLRMLATFLLSTLGWVFFRAQNVGHAMQYISGIFSKTLFQFPHLEMSRLFALQVLVMIVLFVLIEWRGRVNQYAIEKTGHQRKRWIRRGFYIALVLCIFMFLGQEQEFIYFQF